MKAARKKIVLVTGAAGSVAAHLRRALARRYDLRLTDVRPLGDRAEGERFAKANLARLRDALRVTKGVDAIIHLGGYSVEGPWDDILEANIIGCYNVFEAARRHGVRRLLFATSNHAVGFYRRDELIDHRVPVRPDGRYGVSKVFGEALGRLYADKYGLEVFCMRLGNVAPAPVDARRLSIWLSPRDLAQLCAIGLDHPDVRFEIVYGISGNSRAWYDNANAERLGYRPRDDSEPYAAAILAREPPGDPVAARLQGGPFAVLEEIPNPAPLPKRRATRIKERTKR